MMSVVVDPMSTNSASPASRPASAAVACQLAEATSIVRVGRRVDADETFRPGIDSGFRRGNRSAISSSSAATPRLACRENVGQFAGHGEGVEVRAAIERLRLAEGGVQPVEAVPQGHGDGGRGDDAAVLRPA